MKNSGNGDLRNKVLKEVKTESGKSINPLSVFYCYNIQIIFIREVQERELYL